MLHTPIYSDPATASVLTSPDGISMDDLSLSLVGGEGERPLCEVDQAIAAAKAVLPELRRVDAEMDVLWKALPKSAQRIAARDQARLIETGAEMWSAMLMRRFQRCGQFGSGKIGVARRLGHGIS